MNQTFKPLTREQVAPELRSKMMSVPPAVIGSGIGRWILRTVIKLMRSKAHDGVRVETHTAESGVKLRIYTPERGKTGAGAAVDHGGGLVIGSAMQDDQFCAIRHANWGSWSSRRSPVGARFPVSGALDDCHAAWTWLQRSAAALGIDPARIAIGGQSAGGGLAASLVQRIHDEDGVQPVVQWLFCPMLDDRTAARRELDVVGHFVWNNRSNRVGWSAYLAGAMNADRVPDYAVPARRDDLRGLPPAWIGTGDIELFFDEDRMYAERLTGAGVGCTLDIVPARLRLESMASGHGAGAAYWHAHGMAGNNSTREVHITKVANGANRDKIAQMI